MRCAVLLLLLASCNQVYGLDPTRVRTLEPPECSTVQFGAPVELEEFGENDDAEFDPQLSADGLELWYVSNTVGTGQRFLLFRATRTDAEAPFESTLVDLVGDNDLHQGDPAMTADGKRMMFKVSGAPALLYEGIRDDPHQFPFDTIVAVTGFGHLQFGVQAFDLTWDGLRMYYVVDDGELWFAERADRNMPFMGHVAVGVDNVHFPTISGDELELFYTQFTPNTDRRLYRRERADLDSPFGPEMIVLDEGADPDIAPTSSQLIVARARSLALLGRRCD